MATPAAVLHVLVQANTAQATAGLNKFNSQLHATEAQSRRTQGAFKSMAKATAGGLGMAAVGAGVVGATKAFVDFDRSMRNVNSIAKVSEKELKSLSKQVLNLAGQTAQSPKTLADGLYQIVSSGFKANAAIKVLEKSAIAATAGLTDTATAAQIITASINAFGLSAKDAGKVSDILFKTVERGVVTFSDLAQQLGPVLPSAKNLAISLEEVGAAMATLTIQGFPAAEAATALDATMRSLFKPSTALKAAFKELGVSSGEELIQKFGSLQRALVVLRGTTDGSGTAFRKLFNEQRAGRGVMALTGGSARKAAEDLRAMGKSTGATTDAFKEQSKSVGVQWQKMKAQLEAAAVGIGATVLPVLNKIIGAIITWRQVTKSSISAIAKFLTDVWNSPKKAFQNLIASILRGFAKLFDLASKLPIVGSKFKGMSEKARDMANSIQGVGEKASRSERKLESLATQIRNMKGKRIDLKVVLDFANEAFSLGGMGGGKAMHPDMVEDSIREGAQKWVKGNMGKIGPLGMLGGLGNKAAGGSLGAANHPFHRIAQAMGLTVGSGLRPGDTDSWHGVGRARDYPGSPGAMMRFALFLAKNFGSRLKELIYTPLGFSIDNGRRVPPFAQADHYDHVHVAMQKGGVVSGSGSGDKVHVAAKLEPGERFAVLNRTAARVWEAFNGAFPRLQGGGSIGANASGRGGLSSLNKRFPRHGLSDAAGHFQMSERGVRMVAEAAGFSPGVAKQMAQIARGESTFYPGIVSYDGGYGLWQMTPRVWGPTAIAQMNRLGGVNAMLNPVKNAQMAKWLYDSAGGFSPWYGTRYLDRNMDTSGVESVLPRGSRGGGGGGRSRGGGGSRGPRPNTFRRQPRPRGSGRDSFSPDIAAPWQSNADTLTQFYDSYNQTFEKNAALAALTPDYADDVAALTEKQRMLANLLQTAMENNGGAELITNLANELKSTTEAIAQLTPTAQDFANRDLALAQLTDTLADDMAALRTLESLAVQKLDEALLTPDPRDDIEAANELKSVRDSIESLTNELEAQRAAEQALAEAVKQQTEQMKRNEDLIRAQGPALQAAMVQMVNGGIGGNAGLGRQFPSSTGLGGLSRA